MPWSAARRWTRVAGLLALLLAAGCATAQPGGYTPEELRAELLRRVPDLRADEIQVPFEVGAHEVERARELVRARSTPEERIRSLVQGLADPAHFGLRYDWGASGDAAETLSSGRGNCLSLASVLVGVARGLGMRAYYAEATRRDAAEVFAGDIRVWSGHMAAVILSSDGRAFVDFSGTLPDDARYRRISDLRAVAHFYNNRGYSLIHRAQRAGREVPWEQAQRQFEIATRVDPGFARAWNNLGVALARRGDLAGALGAYRRALEVDSNLQAAQQNLLDLEARLASGDGETPLELAGSRAPGP
jgi:tetratricopeptide (TPR) repeat protein